MTASPHDHSASSDRTARLDVRAGKRAAARAAMAWVEEGGVVGVGTGSTASEFARELAAGPAIEGAVASSVSTERLLRELQIEVLDLNSIDELTIYVDGADEIDAGLRLIKGGGGAMTREKVCASASRTFVCIADDTKLPAETLGDKPVPVEVLPIALALVGRTLKSLGVEAVPRESFVTDNGNIILDCTGLDLETDLEATEAMIEALPGVVGCGIFARRRADVVLLGSADGTVRELR